MNGAAPAGPSLRTLALGTLGYGAVTFAVAAPWHFVVFERLYHSLGIYNRPQPSIPLGVASMLVQGAVMSWLYPKACPRERSLGGALAFCWAMGAFLYSVSTMANAAKMEVTSLSTWLTVQAAFHALQFTLVGLAFAWIYRSPDGL